MRNQTDEIASPSKRMPFVTVPGSRDHTDAKDSKLVNCIAEKDVLTDEYWVQKRPGLSIKQTLTAGAGQGIYNWNGVIYSIFGGAVYADSTLLGYVDTDGGMYQFQILKGNPGYLVFGNGRKTYYTQGAAVFEVERNISIPATATELGRTYTIVSSGDTDFTSIGAPNSSVGTTFVATGAGAGTGTVGITCGFNFVATEIVAGRQYVITSIGTSNFTGIGASTNAPGVLFTATGIGTGTGTAALVPFDSGTYYPYYYIGGLVVGLQYVIVSDGGYDWSTVGAGANTPGTIFTATSPGYVFIDPFNPGGINYSAFCALVGKPLEQGKSYTIASVGTTVFTSIGASANTVGQIFSCNALSSGTGYVYPAEFPLASNVKGFAYLDGTLYTMDEQANIWGTRSPPTGAFDQPKDWDPLNVVVARIEPDKGVCLASQMVYVIALKEWTTEVFYDAENPVGSPLSPVQGAKQPYGCLSSDTVQRIDDMLFWVSTNRSASPQVVKMDNLKIQVVSTPAIDRLLNDSSSRTFYSWHFRHGGHRFYGVTIVESDLTLVYDLDQGLWYRWTDTNDNYWKVCSITYAAGRRVAQHYTNGKLYYVEGDYEYPTDDGAETSVHIYTPNATFSTDTRKTNIMMKFNADQQDGSVLLVRWSDDDYKTWTNFRTVELSRKRPILSHCGTFYRRAWHLYHRSPTPFRIKSTDLHLEMGVL